MADNKNIATSALDLTKVFSAVQKTLAQNKTALNEADTYNHDHGSNMAQTFKLITQAVKKKKSAAPSEQLAYASQVLSQKSSSGSAKLYAQGLSNAAAVYMDKPVTPDNALELITSLMGVGSTQQAAGVEPAIASKGLADSLLSGLLGGGGQQQASSAGSNPLSGLTGLLGGLMGGGGQEQQQAPAASSSPLGGLGSLLGGLLGGGGSSQSSQSAQPQSGIDAGGLLQAGMSLLGGQSSNPLQSLIGSVIGASAMSGSSPREQSSSMVINTVLSLITSMIKK